MKLENVHSLAESSNSEDCDENADTNNFEPKQGLKFKLFEDGYERAKSTKRNGGFDGLEQQGQKNRGKNTSMLS